MRNYSGNLGNLIFDEALESIVSRMNEPDLGDVTVISLANYLHGAAPDDWDRLPSLIAESSRIAVLGVGVQCRTLREPLVLHPARARNLRQIVGSGGVIGVRGYRSEQLLADHKIRNVFVTGCPSLHPLGFKSADLSDSPKRVLVAATPAGHFRDTVGEVLAFGYRHEARFLCQTETYGHESETTTQDQVRYFTAPRGHDAQAIGNWLHSAARYCWSLPEWLGQGGKGTLYVGTRFHAAVANLLAGGRALVVVTDARVKEMVDFHALPSLGADEFSSDMGVAELWARADPHNAFVRARSVTRSLAHAAGQVGLRVDSVPEEPTPLVFDWDAIVRALAGGGDPLLTGVLASQPSIVEQELMDMHPDVRGAIASRDQESLIAALSQILDRLKPTHG